jgi:hypothetical protein
MNEFSLISSAAIRAELDHRRDVLAVAAARRRRTRRVTR